MKDVLAAFLRSGKGKTTIGMLVLVGLAMAGLLPIETVVGLLAQLNAGGQ